MAVKVSITKLDVAMELRNNGMELKVYDTSGKHIGDVYVTKTGLTWCKGRTHRENGRKLTWDEFIEFMSPQAKASAVSPT